VFAIAEVMTRCFDQAGEHESKAVGTPADKGGLFVAEYLLGGIHTVLQKIERPLNENERRCLSSPLDTVPRLVTAFGTLRWTLLWVGILALCIFLFAKGLYRPDGPAGVWNAVIPTVFIVGIVSFYFAYMVVSGYFHWSRHARRFTREGAPKIRAALADGQASVCSVTSECAIVIEEFEDEGSAYLFDLGDGTSLYLRGQEYFPEDDDAPWPARQFEIVRTSLDGRLVGIFTGREAVPQVRTVSLAEMPESFLFSAEPKTETILPGQPDEILKRFGYHAA
jgi:hypothetical protein